MLIADLLRHKGSEVITIGPGDSVTQLVSLLTENRIGAVVVVTEQGMVGIVSERDVVHRLYADGADALTAPVSDLMTTDVFTCSPNDSVDTIGSAMTDQRIRHMPVLSDGQLVGIVTIGDVVAGRIRQLELDRGQLENYITNG